MDIHVYLKQYKTCQTDNMEVYRFTQGQ